MGDGDNWEATGKTLGYGSLALLTGNPDTAWDLWTNEDLYHGDTWDQMEENEEKMKEAEAAYEKYVKDVENYNNNTLP